MIDSAKQKGTRKLPNGRFACQEVVTIAGRERSFIWKRGLSSTEGNFNMYECVVRSRPHGDSGLVASELSIGGKQQGRRKARFRKWTVVALLLGGAVFNGGCADDSTADNTRHRNHRHGSGHGREQMETVDRSGDSSPTPAPTPGW
jgi:hypothetical protein